MLIICNSVVCFFGFVGIHFLLTSKVGAEPAPASGMLLGRFADGSSWDRLLSVPVLYRDSANPWLQELAVVGQVQTQYAYGSNASGDYGTADLPDEVTWADAEVRRFRLGMKGRLFGNLSFLNLTDLNPEWSSRIYKRTAETYFTYTRDESFQLSAGKTELKFNREQEYSSRDFLPFERSALGNMLYGGELTGAWVSGSGIADGWLYYMGAFSNDRQDEWSDFEGGTMILLKIGYNYTRSTPLDLAEFKFQFLNNSRPGYRDSSSNPSSPQYSHCFSVSNQIAEGALGFTSEILWADGENGVSNAYELSLMTIYSFSEQFQLITTLEAAGSTQANGIVLPRRYEALADDLGDQRGDRYFAAYAGLNYYIHSNNLKLLSGIKYSYLDGGAGGGDFSGWTWMAGVRIAF